ncbi:MAG: SWIM zinc finger family protein [Desulfobacteraceae bacterium]|nr:SWIM zinc finger family protein [Desulfobacteraceae bacterium]
MELINAMLKGLAVEDLRGWAGSKIFNRGKDYVGNVSDLARTEDGALVAWVSGTGEYATMVSRDKAGDFVFDCTCPYDGGGPCKHVVAVLLAAADALKRKQEIPLIDPNDDRYAELADQDQDDDEEYDDEEPATPAPAPKPAPSCPSPRLKAILSGKTREDLLAMLFILAGEFPEVARWIEESAQLKTGKVDALVSSLRKEIRRLTSEDAWYNPWKDEGSLPDYSHVKKRLHDLFDGGHADAVLDLGEELWEGGNEQVGHSHDEGETAGEIADCLAIVVQALPKSRLTAPEQLLWVVNHELEDEYDLLPRTEELLTDPSYKQEHWRDVSSALELRLKEQKVPKSSDAFSARYRREKVMSWLKRAYQQSGQTEKIIPLLEQEADRCQSYNTLVEALLAEGLRDCARQWCIRGFDKTIHEARGIAARLQEQLRHMAEEDGRLDLAAAYRAENFFDHPSPQAYQELRLATERIKVWTLVRERALDFLRTGRRPVAGSRGEKEPWPLPEPEVKTPQASGKMRFSRSPDVEMLIEIALLEKRNNDAVELYQELRKSKRWGVEIDKQLAKAVQKTHPQVALQIWESIALRLIAEVKPKSYQEAGGYLQNMRKVYESTGRLPEWKTLILRLRVEHKAKRRLLEVLDGLTKDKEIVE